MDRIVTQQLFEKWYECYKSRPVTAKEIMIIYKSPKELDEMGYNPHAIYTQLGKELTDRENHEIKILNKWYEIRLIVIDGHQCYQPIPSEYNDDSQQLVLFDQEKPMDKLYSFGNQNYICAHSRYGSFRTNHLKRFCEEFNIQTSLMSMVARKLRQSTEGWTCRYG